MHRWLALALLAATPLALAAAPSDGWPHAQPETVGLAADALARLDDAMSDGTIPLADSLLVARCGKVVYERRYAHDYGRLFHAEAHRRGPLNAHLTGPYNYFDPAWHPYFHGTDLHSMQSVSKSVTAAIVGTAIQRGNFKASLDTPVLKYFDTTKVRHVDAAKRRMTLRHLLTMTTGLDWNEDLPYDDPKNGSSLMEAGRDWIQFVIDQPMAHEPGTTFAYSSGAAELWAHIFQLETGQDIEQYARRHLFAPLGITRYHWKRTPMGVVDTEGGLYLSTADMAKLGELYLRDGVWKGQRVLAPGWVHDSVSPQVDATFGWKYGYQWWLLPYGTEGRLAWAADGIGGQYVIVLPEDDLVIAVTAWHILDDKDYIEKVLERIRPGIQHHRCAPDDA
ncbi:MAG: serine hydrolase [Proteobacteria bacterium]|nr:serine hydrolase [Pseudomonadota bacterium]